MIPRRRGLLGRLMVSFCMLVGGCRVRFLMRRFYCTLDRRRFGLRMIRMLHALFASSVFPSQLHATLSRTYYWLFSLTSANCLALRPPAPCLMVDSRLCKLFFHLVFVTLSWSTMILLSSLKLAEENCFGYA